MRRSSIVSRRGAQRALDPARATRPRSVRGWLRWSVVLIGLAISGTAQATPQISGLPVELDFGNVAVVTPSATQTITITNTGTSTLVISSANIENGTQDYDVVSGDTGSQMVPPAGSVSWGIVCMPVAQGLRLGTFRINSNATPSIASVDLRCTGQQGGLSVVALPPDSGTTINFGSVTQGNIAGRQLKLRNIGSSAVSNISAVVSPSNAGYSLAASPPVPTTLAAGAEVTLNVRFAPQGTANGGPGTITFTGEWGQPPAQTTAVLSLLGTGVTASYALSANEVDFGNLRFDTTPERTFCITNTGQANVTIQSPISIVPAAGTVTNEFLVVGVQRRATCNSGTLTNASLPQTLAANEVLFVTVRADPANRTGMMQATLTVTSNLATNPTRTLQLRGNSTSGAFTLAPSSMIDFGPVDVQAPAAAQRTVTITNTGDGPLDLGSFSLGPNPAPQLTVTLADGSALPSSVTLPPNATLSLRATYRPVVASTGTCAETVTLSHSVAGAINGPAAQMIVFCGRGIDRRLALLAAPSFPDTFRNPGGEAPVRGARIQNTGEAVLKVSAVMITGDADVWQLLDETPVDLPKDATHEFLVRFSPKRAGRAPDATLVITNDDSDQPMVSINLVGNGLDRSVRFTPELIRLGSTAVGKPLTVEDVLVVTNTDANSTFRIRALELSGDSAFAIEGLTPDLALPPQSERRFAVTFTPDAEGPFTARARLFLDMDPDAQHEVTIEGTGSAPGDKGGCATGRGLGSGAVLLALAALLAKRRRRPAQQPLKP